LKGNKEMTKTTVEAGSRVTIHYKGTLEDGTEFDSSYNREEPMIVEVGSGQLIEGFENALGGMEVGESKTVMLSAEDAYGPRDEDANVTLGKDVFPGDFEFTDGMSVPLSGPEGTFMATLSDITDKTVSADFNHPMAGKDLTFEIEVLSISEDNAAEGEEDETVSS
tara:strand:+ start:1522 stop:2019 length:498 start_codon:yes stop_codon:yes gene_type:complete